MKPGNLRAGLISAWVAACAAGVGEAATYDVSIVSFSFVPPSLTVQMGDTVRWTNQDPTQHTATSDTGVWDSGLLWLGGSFSFTFTGSGVYGYHCTVHPYMQGTITVQGGTTNQPPIVSLVSPTNGAVFAASASVTIQASAQDPDGTVMQVQFLDGANSLGVAVNSPYEITLTLSPGIHVLTAVATDNQNAMTTSAPVTITVSSVPIVDPIPGHIPKGDITLELQPVLAGLASPLGLVVPPDGSGRMFVYDQVGLVWVVTATGAQATPLLDVRNRLTTLGVYDERGLLGLAVHPGFATNHLLYTYTSEPVAGLADFMTLLAPGETNDHQSVIAEWRIDTADTNRVDLTTRREIMRIDEPEANNNGGALHFGPDGYLYVGLGDGGSEDDQGVGHLPQGNGQSLNTILGKIIRLDVNGRNSANGQYGVPVDNPFVGTMNVVEIYAYGLRNPFSFDFDRLTGDLLAGDVGQNDVEEIDVVTRGGNYGWNPKEGSFYFDPNGTGPGYVTTTPVSPIPPGLIDPIAEYDHDEGSAVIGGYRYRGTQIPALQGRYVFGDWGSLAAPSGRLFYLDATNAINELRLGVDDRPLGFWLKGFGQDAAGELYLFASRTLGPVGDSGMMFKLVSPPSPIEVASTSVQVPDVTSTWTGGQGPFALQKKADLSDPVWQDVNFTAQATATAPLDTDAGFFRVADTASQPAIPLAVYLDSALEVPAPTGTGATGSGLLSLVGDVLRFDLRYEGLSAPATAAHIHGPADTTQATNVLVSLVPFNGGAFGVSGALSGTVLLTDEQKAMVLAGKTYVNFHTTNHPAGELRGQIAPVMMQAVMSGANERPAPLDNAAHGLGTFTLVGTNLSFNLTYGGLSAPATAAHIHAPATTAQATNVIVSLAPFNGGAFGTSGSLEGTVGLTPPQLAWVIDGLSYVNFHTTNHPAGELRGQIRSQATAVPLTARLNGLLERPTALTNSATGSATFSLEGQTLAFNVNYSGLSAPATAAHIHGPATTAEATNVLISLAPFNGGAFGIQGTLSGSVTVTPQQREWLLAGLTYVNFHTTNNPAGELRGQIAPVLMRASLNGNNEQPNPIVTPGFGSGTFALVWDNLNLAATYRDLLSPATASHIHGPASVFQSVSVLVSMEPFNGGAYGSSGSLAGTAPLSITNLAALIDGQTYLNFHTTNNPSGEIRGQITR